MLLIQEEVSLLCFIFAAMEAERHSDKWKWNKCIDFNFKNKTIRTKERGVFFLDFDSAKSISSSSTTSERVYDVCVHFEAL